MGTNYYVEAPATPWGVVPSLHVGKASGGWKFCFQRQEIGERQIATARDWRSFIDEMVRNGACVLRDEYGSDQDVDEFWAYVESKQTERNVHTDPGYFYQDYEGYDMSFGDFS